MYKESVIRLVSKEEYRNREKLLAQLEKEVERGCYSPRPIHSFLSTPKANGIARFVPVLSFQDVAVYFACVKTFDEKLASLAVENTYGGWSLGGKRREFEEKQARAMFDSDLDVSVPVSVYNRSAWVENWQQYWKLLAAKFEHAPTGSYFAMFDVANFYDTIDLPRLERELRRHCPDQGLAIEVLFYLLSTWNKNLNQYARTTKGIPMDIVGDCSRVLANFYLTPFDCVMREKSQGCGSHFMRYADDMVLACPDLNTCEKLVFFASSELHRIGLNINVAKVKYLSKEEFELWWGFKILDDLEVDERLVEGLNQLRSSWDDKRFGRRETALKRAITKLAKCPKLHRWRRWAYETAYSSESFLLVLDERQMRNLLCISEIYKTRSNLYRSAFYTLLILNLKPVCSVVWKASIATKIAR